MVIQLQTYNILLADSFEPLADFLQQKQYSQQVILVDENTKQHCLPLVQNLFNNPVVIEIQSGERNKNLDTCTFIWQQLLAHNIDRNAVCINLGGGVLGDMGGFAASCYKRGIAFIQIPTTVLSQVDSSIGGKLGIDLSFGKNLIGVFNNPDFVYINPIFFKTLPQRQFINGWAEIFKHSLIQNANLWQQYLDIDIFKADMNTVQYHSLQIKKNVVEQDPYEKGLRKILNFGHTIGHAIEAYSVAHETDALLHGEAIAIGMICEAYLAHQKTNLSLTELNAITQQLLRYFPKYDISNFDIATLISYTMSDKKNNQQQIKAALLTQIGSCTYDIELTHSDIKNAINYYTQL